MRRFLTPALGLFAAVSVFGQAKLEFEVASIRGVDAPQEGVAVGLRQDGSQVHVAAFTMRDYLAMAYRVRPYQITAPDWAGSTRFDLNAKLPDGSNSDQIPDMLETLLEQRFGMKIHHEQKEQAVYALILGKTPLKLQKSAPSSDDPVPAGARTIAGTGNADGVSIDLGHGSYYTFKDNKFEIKKVNMDTLARLLERYLDRPLVNMTGLDGEYDLMVEVTQEDYYTMLMRAAVNSGVTLPPQALQLLDRGSIASLTDGLEHLGLKLDARRSPLDMIVVDRISKTPTDN